MPHYKDGTEAKVGDLVRGFGYNVKHEIIGKVIQLTKACPTCNIAVAYIGENSPLLFNQSLEYARGDVTGHAQLGWGAVVLPNAEYGEAASFEKIG
jgi:hypothetical protein